MKILTVLFILISMSISAQTDAPRLVINFSKIEMNPDSITNNYKIISIVCDDYSVSFKEIIDYWKAKRKKDKFFKGIRDNSVGTYFYDNDYKIIYAYTYYHNKGHYDKGYRIIVNKNEIIYISIINQNHQMNIFIVSDRYIGIDSYLKLENLSFKEGDYFYDMNDKEIDDNIIECSELQKIEEELNEPIKKRSINMDRNNE